MKTARSTSAVATTAERVRKHTSPRARARIEDKTRTHLRAAAGGGRREITRRLRKLDREWDVERMIEANSSTLALTGTLLGVFVNRWFLLLPGAVTAFLLQHALQGWCPPIPLLRRLGFRTAEEIGVERTALKTLRGDFRGVRRVRGPAAQARALRAAKR
jgi:hypothetical protein